MGHRAKAKQKDVENATKLRVFSGGRHDELEMLRRENAALKRQVAEQAQQLYLAMVDPLTGLYNRRYFEAQVKREIARCRRHRRCFSMFLIDLNDFKLVNDTLGHPAGDRLLRAFATRLQQSVRQQDLCCRLGGDEFLVLLPDTDLPSAKRLETRLSIKLDLWFRQEASPASVSMGTSTYGADGVLVEDLVAVADARMYRHKAACKGQRVRASTDEIRASRASG